jgi:tetratricopeptide (TPR) repeat protein
LEPDFVIPWRNLSLAYFNVRRDIERAQACYRKAMALDSQNVRLFYEYDILLRQMGTPPAERLARLEQSLHLVEQRDELYLERVALYNRLDQPQKALDLLQAHQFNPWEGGESAIGFQYMMALLLLGVDALHAGQMEQALKHFETAISYPDNLGAGNWSLVMAVPARYFVAIAREKLGDRQTAQAIFREIAGLTLDFWRLLYLPELNYYRGAALQNLGDKVGARREFQSLLDTASQKETESAYATFVPNFLVFDNDPHKVVRVEIIYLRGLAWLGLNQADQARQAFEEVLKLDVNHLKAHFELRANF